MFQKITLKPAVAIVVTLVLFTAGSLKAQGPWLNPNTGAKCPTDAFLSITSSTNGDATNLFSVDLFSGARTVLLGGIDLLPSPKINGLAYNTIDGYLWASKTMTSDIIRIGNNGTITSFTITGPDWNFDGLGFNVGDVGPDGKFYVAERNKSFLSVVDLNSGSPSTSTKLSTDIVAKTGAGFTHYDHAINPVDGQLYAIGGGGFAGAISDIFLFKINLSTGVVTRLSPNGGFSWKQENADGTFSDVSFPIIDFQARIGAVYFDPQGNFYAVEIAERANQDFSATNGRIYKFPAVQNYTGSAIRTAFLVGSNLRAATGLDGARCPLAPVPCPSINKPTPQTAPACVSGSTFDLTTLNPSPAAGFTTYEWRTGGNTVAGSTVVANPKTAAVPGTYYMFAKKSGTDCYHSAPDALGIQVVLTAGPTAPTLSATTGQICPGNTFSLTGLITSTAPSGITYEWWTTTARTSGTQVTTPTAVNAGTYYGFAKNSTGCYGSATAAVTVSSVTVATPSPTTTGFICTPATTFNLTTLIGTAPSGTTYEWWTTNTRTAGTQVAAPTTAAAGTYYLFARNTASGCYSLASSLVTITAAPKPVPTAFTLNGCGTVSLTSLNPAAVSGFTYEWHTSATVATGTLVSSPGTVATSGTYYLHAKRSSGTPACYGPASDPVTVSVTPPGTAPVPVATTGDICNPATNFNLTTLQPADQAGFTYEWWTTATRNTGTQVSSPSTAGAGTYYLFSKNTSDGCYSSASSAVTISSLSAAPTKTIDAICSTSTTYNLTTIQPTAVSGVTYEWWTTSTRSAGTQVATPSAVAAGVYYFFGKKGTDCYNAPTTVTIVGKPVPTAFTATNTCPGTVNLTTLQPPAVAGFTYEWYLKSTNTKVATPSAVTVAGTYYLLLRNNTTTTCATASSDDVVVTVNDCAVPLTCTEGNTYFFQQNGTTGFADIYQVNLCTGARTLKKSLTYASRAAGYNPVTNLIWASDNTNGGGLVRFDADFNQKKFTITNNSGTAMPNNNWNMADFDASGKMYLTVDSDAGTGVGTMYIVDLNPSSAGYLKFTTVTLSTTKIWRDWAMNPIDENLYALENNSANLYRITKTGTVTQVATVKNSSGGALSNEAAGVQYFDGAGNFWFIQHTAVGIWRLPSVSTFTTGTTSRNATLSASLSSGITLSQPDGVRCNTAPACGSECPTTVSLPSTGNICSPATTFNLTTVQPTVDASLVAEWWTGIRGSAPLVSNPAAVGAGTYYLYFKRSDGTYCSAFASIAVAAAPAKPTPTTFTPAANICPGTTVNLTAIQPAAVTGQTYEWHTASTVGANTLVATPSAVTVAGTYYLFRKLNSITCYGPASNPVTVTINICNRPPTAFPNAYSTAEDTPVSGNVISDLNTDGQKDTDPDNNTLSVTQFAVNGTTYTAGTKATIAGVGELQVNADGSFTFTPALNYNGPVPQATYTVSDGNGLTASSTLDLTVTPVNDPPVAANDTNTTPEDTPVSGNVLPNDTDPEGNAFAVSQFAINGTTYTAGQTASIPGVGTIVVNSNGSYTFTPAPNYNGTVPTINYTVAETPSGPTASANLNLTVTPANDPPVALDDSNVTDEDVPVSGTVLPNDSDIDGDVLSVTGFTVNGATITAGQTATLTGFGTIKINADGTYTFTPAPNFNGTVPPIPYAISDGKGGTATANLNLTVRPVNDAPVAVDDSKTTPEDTPVSASVLPNDTDPENDPITVTGFSVNGQSFVAGETAPISGVGTIKLNADGTYTFTPEPNYNGTVPPVDYTVTDGKGVTASAKLNITVTPVNDPPVADNDTEDTPNFTPVSGTLFSNDRDIDGDTFAVSGVSLDGTNFVAPGIELTFTEGKITVNADGTYTFTPADGFFGTVPPIYYKVTDPDNLTSNVARLDLTVTFENVPPVAVDDVDTTDEDVPVSGNVITDFDANNQRDSDVDSPITELVILDFTVNNKTYAAGTTAPLPGVGTLVINADGSWTFTPELNYNGPVPVATYTLADNPIDGNDGTDTATLTITITPVNDPPKAINDNNITPEDTPVSANVLPNDSDIDGDVLSVSEFKVNGTTYTAGTTATITGVGTIVINTDGTYTFTPALNYNGTVPTVNYTVSDGKGGTANANLDIIVTPVNDNPVAVNNDHTTLEDTPVSGNVVTDAGTGSQTDSDPDNDPLTVTGFSVNGTSYNAGSTATINGVGTLVLNANGTWTFTPEKDYNGPVPSATYTINDGNGGTASAVLTITITPVNDNPVAVNDTNTTMEDTPVSANVLPNDSDVEGNTLTVTGFTVNGTPYTAGTTATIPDVGTIVVNADGSYTFTPEPDFSGTVPTVGYAISDGNGGTASANLDITVTPVNDPPVAVADVDTTPEDTPVSDTVLPNDSDVDNDPLTVTGFSVGGQSYAAGATATIPGVGTLVINADGTYTFTPEKDFNGTVPTANYTISDGKGGTASTTLDITVTPAPDAPVAADDSNTTPEDTPVSNTVLPNDSDVDGDVLSVTQFTVAGVTGIFTAGQTATIPDVGTLVINADGTYTFTPEKDYNGTVPTATYTISDGNGGTDTADLAITVTPVNDQPIAYNNSDETIVNTPVSGNVLTDPAADNSLDSDPDNDPLTVSGFTVNGQSYNAGTTATIAGVGTIVINTDGSWTFTPETNYLGIVPTVNYQISDGNQGSAAADLDIVVKPEIKLTPIPDINGTFTNTPVTGDVSTNDANKEGATYGAPVPDANNPAGAVISLNPDGTYEFTAPLPGIYVYAVDACKPGQTSECEKVNLTITVLDAKKENPPVANTDVATTPFETPVTLKTLSNDAPGFLDGDLDPASVAIVMQPASGTVSVDPQTGDITFTPAQGFVGVASYTYKVCDTSSPAQCTEAVQEVTVLLNNYPNVTAAADDYAITSDKLPVSGSVVDNDKDPEGNSLTVTPQSNVTLPEGTFDLAADGSYTFTPKEGFQGALNIVYDLCDDGSPQACTQATLYIQVIREILDTNPDVNATFANVPVSGDVSTNDLLISGTTYGTPVADASNPGPSTITLNPDGTYDFTAPAPGVYVFDVPYCTPLVTTNCPTEKLTITVLDPAAINPPVAHTDIATTKLDTPVTLNTLGNDLPGDIGGELNPASVEVSVQPANGTVSVDPATGAITYTPAAGFTGVDTYTYKVCDKSPEPKCTTAIQEVTVLPADYGNQTLAADDYATATGLLPAEGNVLNNDQDAEGNTQTVTPQSLSLAEGEFELLADGSFTFVPAPGFSGPLNIPYSVCDNGSPVACASATVYLLVTPADSDPDVNATFANALVKGDVSTNDDIPYPVTYGTPAEISKPDGATATITLKSDGTYDFKADKSGIYVYEVPVCGPGQSGADCPIEMLTITVLDKEAEVNKPVANVDIAYTLPATAVTLKTLANDGPGTIGKDLDPATVAVATQPANGTVAVDPATGDITYTPNADFSGVDIYTYTVCDTNNPADCVTAQQEVTVLAPGASNTTQAADDYASTLEGAAVSGSVLTNDTDAEGDNVTVTPQDLTLPEGKFTLAADGSYTFTPALGFSGPLNIPYTKCDDGSPVKCADATLYILVKPFDPQPDVNATYVGTPISGTIVTNDQVYSGALYDLDSEDPANPTGATITINPDGTYDFSATQPGVYVYYCLLCQQLTNSGNRQSGTSGIDLPYRSMADLPCKPVTLTITVLDPFAASNGPIANTDIASTLQETPVVLKTLTNDRPGSQGLSLVPSTVAIETQPANGTVSVNATTGDITYTPNAGFTGIDEYTYKICDSQNPSKCTTATQKVTVLEPTSVNSTLAADDFNVATGPVPITGNLLTNDTDPQGQPQTVVPQNLSLTEGTFVLNANGTYTFTAAQGFSGPVEIPYTACDNGTPQACANATLYILVSPASIDAVNNDFTATPVNGYTGGTAGNIYPNDLVNGQQLQAAQVTLTLVNNGGVTGLSISSTGDLIVPAGTPAGTYTATYKICQVQVPAICDEATVIFVVNPPVILATTDDFRSVIVSNEEGGEPGNIFPNDALNNNAISGGVRELVTITILDDGGIEGLVIDENGNITVPAGTPVGSYTARYKICENLNPDNCSEADVLIDVIQTELIIPTGISPNGDGKNEVWEIKGLSGYPNHEIAVYNRWGNEVFRAKPYQNNWDGRSTNSLTIGSNNRLPAGTYFWVLNLGNGEKKVGYLYIAY